MKFWFLFVVICFNSILKAQTITTYVGGSVIGDPNGLAFDKNGDLYIGSPLGNKIWKVDTTGTIVTFAGTGTAGFSGDGGPATSAKLNGVGGIAIDSLGNVLFCDGVNSRIRKINVATGIISTIVGNTTAGFYGDGGPASAASIFFPQNICFDKFGNYYFGDGNNFRIRKVNTLGIISTFAGNGTLGDSGDGGQATNAAVYPTSIAIDNIGNMYVNQFGVIGSGCKIRKINTSGIISTFAGDSASCTYTGDGIPATAAHQGSNYIAFYNGMLFMCDGCNSRIRMIDNSGIIHTVAGDGIVGDTGDGNPATSAELSQPSGIAFDHCGNLYIAEVSGPDIRKVSFNPLCWPAKEPEVINNEVLIYPNPVENELHVDNVKTRTAYRLLNITGIIEQSGTLHPGSNTISLYLLPKGLYLFVLADEQGYQNVRKVIKE